jgi:hypothetical protein
MLDVVQRGGSTEDVSRLSLKFAECVVHLLVLRTSHEGRLGTGIRLPRLQVSRLANRLSDLLPHHCEDIISNLLYRLVLSQKCKLLFRTLSSSIRRF